MIEKLQKLIAMEKSARSIGNLAEAAAFAAKVQELLFKYNLDMSEVEIKTQEAEEPVDQSRVQGVMRGGRQRWLELLAAIVARSCFCQTLIVPTTTIQIFVGRTSDRMAAATLFLHLATSALELCRRELKAALMEHPWKDTRWRREWRKSFYLGFVAAIYQRLTVERSELESATGGCALVLRKSEAVTNWMQTHQTGGKARKVETKARIAAGYFQGHAAGMNVSTSAQPRLSV